MRTHWYRVQSAHYYRPRAVFVIEEHFPRCRLLTADGNCKVFAPSHS